MKRFAFLAVACLLALLVFAACRDVTDPSKQAASSALDPSSIISDGANEGNDRFFFLPPMVPDPTVSGTFDGTLRPVVDICDWDGAACATNIATFDMTTGPGSETVRVVPEDEHYIVNWHTDEFGLDAAMTYRIRVVVGGIELGYADVDVVSNGNELKNVETGEFIGLKDGRTLAIKFRIEEGAVFVVGSGGGTISAEDGDVTMEFPAGALSGDEGITIQPVTTLPTGVGLVPGAVFDFEPDGTIFGQPVQLTIAYDETSLPAGTVEADLVLLTEESGVWDEVPGSVVDEVANTVAATISGFSGKGAGNKVASVDVAPGTAELEIAETVQLAATPRNAAGDPLSRAVTWSTSDAAVATADANGLVTAVADGNAIISAKSGGATGTTAITVVSVVILPPPPFRVSGGLSHTCSVADDGTGRCWGSNSHGQLGDGTTIDRTTPTPVAGGLTFESISAGHTHSCGIAVGGQAYCWGDNFLGLLGDGTANPSSTPVAVSGGLNFLNLDAGWRHTCGATSDGSAYCWGSNFRGQLGDGTTNAHNTPMLVSGGLQFVWLGVNPSNTTCGLTTTGVMHCWGENNLGQLGDGTTTNRSTPGPIAGGQKFVRGVVGGAHACGVSTSGDAYCWGRNQFGQFGSGSTGDSSIPVLVSGGLSFQALTAGGFYTCGQTTGGVLYCWGANFQGGLGDGTMTDRLAPTAVSGGLMFDQAEAGVAHTCARTSSDEVYCWGANGSGQLGDGTMVNRNTPVIIPSACVAPPPGLVSWWSGDGDASDNQNQNDGVLLNGAAFAPGFVGQAFSFDGSNDHVRIPDAPSLDVTESFSIDAWIYPTSVSGNPTVLAKWDAVVLGQRSYVLHLGFHTEPGRILFRTSPDGGEPGRAIGTVISNSAVAVNTWTHVAGVYDGAVLKVYVNGVLDNQLAYTGGIHAGTNDASIGAVVGGVPSGSLISPFAGLMDEVRLLDRALTAQEVQDIFSAGSAGRCKP